MYYIVKNKKVKLFCVSCCRKVDRCIEHRKPRSQGGSDNIENIQPMCPLCHKWKHENPSESIQKGYTLRTSDKETPWWIDFPHSIIGSVENLVGVE